MNAASTPMVFKSLEELGRPLSPAAKARLAKLRDLPDSAIDCSDIPKLSPGFMKTAKRLGEVFPKMAAAIEEIRTQREEAEALAKAKVTLPAAVDVRHIREELKMSQGVFADSFGLSVNAVRHWEAGRRIPEAAARALLTVIAYNPRVVLEALGHPAVQRSALQTSTRRKSARSSCQNT